MTGSSYERRLASLLDTLGYAVVRSPASGSVDRDQPDLLAGHPTEGRIALEIKSGKASTLYVEEAETLALERFAALFDADPYLVARWTSWDTGREYYCVAPENARMTDSGSYGLPKADIEERASITFDRGGGGG